MKKNLHITILLVILMSFSNIYAASSDLIKDGDNEKSRTSKKEQKLTDAEVEKLVNRINEIKSINIKELPPVERRELRKEVRDIRKKLDKNADGFSVYIGGGVALAAVIILLILLL